MHPELLHLIGPLSINSFGLMIVIGLITFSFLLLKDPKRPIIISTNDYFSLLTPAILAAIAGGRLLFVFTHGDSLSHWTDIIAIWKGGFSLLGGIIALLLIMPWCFKKYNIAPLPFLDLVGIYAPLLQSISRIGCFLGGCCYGCPASYLFEIHPTQLYSAFSLFLIFLLQFFIISRWKLKPGQLFCIYLMLMSLERFTNDFFRGEREMSSLNSFSLAQLISIVIFVCACCAYVVFNTEFKKLITVRFKQAFMRVEKWLKKLLDSV